MQAANEPIVQVPAPSHVRADTAAVPTGTTPVAQYAATQTVPLV